ncbi:MAG: peroxiredoxin-like protein [Candidatus Aramenus sulfurataquae]|jgi:predicted peroxiredoxin|uniref:DsrE/DsrF/DrsH-like family protein n=2 Tax=Candidatus Aramenus sulfurataquae TaxID=1326980 RepID=W7KWT8_9CREN|nr:MAG: peroxiredoxin-like protein [Candidatus Aramenus sulfurataquae]MCL7343517.1 DsrE/DsrF/DrsH-like family protein [Candidatus Aramenus sulfurataquae]
MTKLTILLADDSFQKFYHALVLAIDGKALNWTVKCFVTSQAVILFTKKVRGRAKLKLGFLANLYVRWKMKDVGVQETEKLLMDAIREGVEFYVDEAGLKLSGFSKDDLLEGVKLAGAVTFLLEAKDSDLVITL